jgi:hypothetical protein
MKNGDWESVGIRTWALRCQSVGVMWHGRGGGRGM